MNIRQLIYTAAIAAIAIVTSVSAQAQENNAALQWTTQQDVLPEAVARPFFGVIGKTNARRREKTVFSNRFPARSGNR